MESGTRTLLVVEDDALLGRAVADLLESPEWHVVTAQTLAQARDALGRCAPDAVLLDEQLPDGQGHALCAPLLESSPAVKIIFTTAFPSFEHAVQALRLGAYDYLSKPYEVDDLRLTLQRAMNTRRLERLEGLARYHGQKDQEQVHVVGDSPAARAVRDLVALAAGSLAPVLITGETGTGKGLVARSIHLAGRPASAPWVSVNCAALPENLVEAELFGWERGAFTGAVATREGLVEMAEDGTLFLDEIGEMPLALQPKLLALLDEGEVKRVGGRCPRRVNTRLVAATNAALEQHVREKRFRADLFYRLNVLRIHVAPLRERTQDLPALCRHLLERLGGSAARLAPGEAERLGDYPWPGNVRELRNVLERSLILHRDVLRPSLLLGDPATMRPEPSSPVPPESSAAAGEQLDAVERRHILGALETAKGNVALAARTLGVSESTLKRRLRAWGVQPSRSR